MRTTNEHIQFESILSSTLQIAWWRCLNQNLLDSVEMPSATRRVHKSYCQRKGKKRYILFHYALHLISFCIELTNWVRLRDESVEQHQIFILNSIASKTFSILFLFRKKYQWKKLRHSVWQTLFHISKIYLIWTLHGAPLLNFNLKRTQK